MIAAYQGRCPTCGHDSTRDAEAIEDYKQWIAKRVVLEGDCEIGVGWQLAAVSTAPQPGTTEGREPSNPPPSADSGGEAGWLIEDMNEPKWLTLKPAEAMWSMVFTPDNLAAVRFSRRADAEDYVACHLDDAPVRITEHSWPNIRPRQALAQPAQDEVSNG